MSYEHIVDTPVSLANKVGVVVKLTDRATQSMHVGLVFETAGVLRMADLANHEWLRCIPLREGGYAWADCRWLKSPVLADTVVDTIKASLRKDKVPYGLEPDLDSFRTGVYASSNPIFGLTCATYVAAVLKGAGIEVLDIATWRHRPEDDVWSEAVVEMLRLVAPVRARELEGQRARFRVRPDELAFAAASTTLRTDFDTAVAGSVGVRTVLLEGPRQDRGAVS